MAARVESFITTTEGELIIPPWFSASDSRRIYASILTVGDTVFQNYRYFSSRSFFGYIQLFDGESVAQSVTMEYGSQTVYSKDDCCIAAMEDRCRKYSCLAAKLDWIGNLLTLAFPPIATAIGMYPVSSDAANYGEDLIMYCPTSIAWQWERDVSVLIEFVADEIPLSPCNPPIGSLPSPEGCRGPNETVPDFGTCVPTTPTGGGGT